MNVNSGGGGVVTNSDKTVYKVRLDLNLSLEAMAMLMCTK